VGVNQRATEARGSLLLIFVTRKYYREIAIVESCYLVKTSASRLSVQISNSVIVICTHDL
jgi:hypothetical protein